MNDMTNESHEKFYPKFMGIYDKKMIKNITKFMKSWKMRRVNIR